MDKNKQYSKFLKTFKNKKTSKLMESIITGFKVLYEADGLNKVNPNGGHKVALTYEIITEESAAHGDAEERGWLDEEGVDVEPDFYDIGDAMDDLKLYDDPKLGLKGDVDSREDFSKLPDELKKKVYQLALFKETAKVFEDNWGAEGVESSSGGRAEPGAWYTSYKIDSRENLESGNTENRGLHLKGFTDEEEINLHGFMKTKGVH